MFKFKTVNEVTDISIDDVTIIADYCSKYHGILLMFLLCVYAQGMYYNKSFVDKTVSTLLNKGKGIQCTFGGDFDLCFRQDESNDDTNWYLTNVRIETVAPKSII